MGDGPETESISAEDRPAAVARLIVRATAALTGRGPSRARAEFGTDVITVVVHDTLTKGERALVDDGQGEIVQQSRRALVSTMRQSLIDGVEEITGRTVLTFLFDHNVESDVGAKTFILRPLAAEGDPTAAEVQATA